MWRNNISGCASLIVLLIVFSVIGALLPPLDFIGLDNSSMGSIVQVLYGAIFCLAVGGVLYVLFRVFMWFDGFKNELANRRNRRNRRW